MRLRSELSIALEEVEILKEEVAKLKELAVAQEKQQSADAVEEYIHMTVMLLESKYPNEDASTEWLIDFAKKVPLDCVYDRLDAYLSRDDSVGTPKPRRKGSDINFERDFS